MPQKCASCHADQVKAVPESSVHGGAARNGDSQSPTCLSCHGPIHKILSADDPLSPVAKKNLPATCGACHSNPDFRRASHQIPFAHPVEAYSMSVHGRAVAAGNDKAASCSDCHGSHGILDARDPQSKINHWNVPATCGTCHVEIKTDLRPEHSRPGRRERIARCSRLHGLPRRTQYPRAERAGFHGESSPGFSRDLRALPRRCATRRALQPARGSRAELRGQLSRARIARGRTDRGELCLVPRRAQYFSFQRSPVHGEPGEPRAYVRSMPRRRGEGLCDRARARLARIGERAPRRAFHPPELLVLDSARHRIHVPAPTARFPAEAPRAKGRARTPARKSSG